LKLATGKYIQFLDSDDWLSDLQPFLQQLSSMDVDLVFTSINRYNDETKKYILYKIHNVTFNKEYDSSSFSFIDTGDGYKIYNFWFCTYRTVMLQQEQPLFVEKVYYDDAILYLVPIIVGKTMCFLDQVLYNYRFSRPGQSSGNIETEKAHSMILYQLPEK
jgi:hypothetical protein